MDATPAGRYAHQRPHLEWRAVPAVAPTIVLDVVGAVLLVIGLTLMTISVGVLGTPSTYSQLHAQGSATGPG